MLYAKIWRHLYDIFLNVHASTDDKCDNMKDKFYEELQGVFHQFWKYHIKILLWDYNMPTEKIWIEWKTSVPGLYWRC
jgi:hypothetical protein